MTTRLKRSMQLLCIVLIPMLFSCTSHLQKQKEDIIPPPTAAPKAESAVPAAAPAAVEPIPAAPERAVAAPAPAVVETEAVEPVPAELHPYIIKKGDTLWDIANASFKDPFLWPFIWKANPAITNPDLIYAGNKLALPGLAPIERALQAEPAPEKPLVVRKATAAVEEPVQEAGPRAGIVGAHVTSPKPVQPAPTGTSEEIPTAVNRLVMPDEQIFPIIDRYAMLSAGFVNEEEKGDVIVGSPEKGQSVFSYDEVVYVSMHNADAVRIGDKYLIYSTLQKVKHPKTGKNFGRLIKGLGILEITAKDPAAKVLTARVTLSFDAIEKGNQLTPYQEPVPVYSPEKKAKDISGYILEVTDRRSINGQTDVVYLDKGNADGVESGDRFFVYEEPAKRGFPKKLIGEVQVMLVKEHTSTAVVQKSIDAMGRGNEVEFEK